jgi:glutathione S-transferase
LVNPSGIFPVVVDGSFKILGGGGSQIYLFIIEKYPAAKDLLYKEDMRANIEKHLAWYSVWMKPSSNNIIKMIVQMNGGDKSQQKLEQLKKEKEEYFTRMLSALNAQL